MTSEEALALKPGDVVQAHIDYKPTPVVVVTVCPLHHDSPSHLRCTCYPTTCTAYARVRRHGPKFARANGSLVKWPSVRRCAALLKHLPDTPTANVYADWLEENGELAAAHKLREAFPLCDGSAKP